MTLNIHFVYRKVLPKHRTVTNEETTIKTVKSPYKMLRSCHPFVCAHLCVMQGGGEWEKEIEPIAEIVSKESRFRWKKNKINSHSIVNNPSRPEKRSFVWCTCHWQQNFFFANRNIFHSLLLVRVFSSQFLWCNYIPVDFLNHFSMIGKINMILICTCRLLFFSSLIACDCSLFGWNWTNFRMDKICYFCTTISCTPINPSTLYVLQK